MLFVSVSVCWNFDVEEHLFVELSAKVIFDIDCVLLCLVLYLVYNVIANVVTKVMSLGIEFLSL